jgi:hypothetical protein
MYVLAVVGVAAGRDADEALEMPGEVAQIEESGSPRPGAAGPGGPGGAAVLMC